MDKKEGEIQQKNRHRCIKCGSLLGYLKLKENAWQCRCCGFLDKEVKD
jgi:ribosomal protein L37AE/L43A